MTRKKLVRLVMQRWCTERAYGDLKGELGLDHYEGRRYPGWHHEVSAVLACYALWSPSERAIFPSRPEGRWPVTRSRSRGLSVSSTIASSPSGSRSRAQSHAGCRDQRVTR